MTALKRQGQNGQKNERHGFALLVFVDFKFKNHGLHFVKGLSAGVEVFGISDNLGNLI
jgi:hypothetical protein